MVVEILVVGGIALILGAGIAYLLRNKIKSLTKQQRKISKIINDPDLLLKELKKNGKMVDLGEELNYSVVEEDGEKKLSLSKVSAAPKPEGKPQAKKKGGKKDVQSKPKK